jgi:hypothetical protein
MLHTTAASVEQRVQQHCPKLLQGAEQLQALCASTEWHQLVTEPLVKGTGDGLTGWLCKVKFPKETFGHSIDTVVRRAGISPHHL